MEKIKRITLAAHDNRKRELKEWVEYNCRTLVRHKLVSTRTTGRLVKETISRKFGKDRIQQEALNLKKLNSGPLGGDQHLGGMIVEGKINFIVFFRYPMEPFSHGIDSVFLQIRPRLTDNLTMGERSLATIAATVSEKKDPKNKVTYR
jgi:methylglyoxal synthase